MAFRKDPVRQGKKDHEGQRILLVEDSRMFSTAIRYRLQTDLGAIVVHCPSFSALKDELSRPDNDFALAILDLNQADGPDGEALDFVLARGMKPIVFTASYNSDVRDRIMAGNAVDFVMKNSPESIDNLVKSVDKTLKLAKPQVLIVDDIDENVGDMCDIIHDNGYRFLHCASVGEALRLLDELRNIELVLMRADLEEGGPARFVSSIKERMGEGALRLIGYASPGQANMAADFFKVGGDDFMHWPGESSELVSRLGRALEQHQQLNVLKRMASRDFLTDLFNRRYFFDRGTKLVEMCLRQDKPVAAAILDIDHFKKLNDNYGHEIGDVVLKSIARKLRAIVGEQEHLLARLGGEEFGIIFAGLDIKAAFEFCDMLREEISKSRIVVDEEELSVTISLGLAGISESETFDNYLNAADQYLYMAKHSGRNRVFSDYQVLQSTIAVKSPVIASVQTSIASDSNNVSSSTSSVGDIDMFQEDAA